MFGIGTWELVIIVALALIILGPAKLPEVARALGKTFSQLRRSVEDVKREIDVDGLRRDIEKEIGVEDLKSFNKDMNNAARSLLEVEPERPLADAKKSLPAPRDAGSGPEESDSKPRDD